METYQWPDGSDIISMSIRKNTTGRAEAVISLAKTPTSPIANLPNALRKDGMTADPTVSSGRIALRVRGFTNVRQLTESIANAGFGSPLNAPQELPRSLGGTASIDGAPLGHRG